LNSGSAASLPIIVISGLLIPVPFVFSTLPGFCFLSTY